MDAGQARAKNGFLNVIWLHFTQMGFIPPLATVFQVLGYPKSTDALDFVYNKLRLENRPQKFVQRVKTWDKSLSSVSPLCRVQTFSSCVSCHCALLLQCDFGSYFLQESQLPFHLKTVNKVLCCTKVTHCGNNILWLHSLILYRARDFGKVWSGQLACNRRFDLDSETREKLLFTDCHPVSCYL